MGNAPNGMSLRERYTLAGAAHRIPDNTVDDAYWYLVNWFWELRSYVGDNYTPLTPDCVPKWLPDKYPSCDECATLLAMDYAYRVEMGKTVAAIEKKRRGE
jgi:hypothetical protein